MSSIQEKSRRLWEEVFPEDSPEFLDYYDRYVADHNRIYADEEEGTLVSMLHMNPYCICAGECEAQVNYIVAVATKKEYRHQGRMRRLLGRALKDSYQKEEPFAFLMPASEAIYRPFGFRTVRWQDVLTLGGPYRCGEKENTMSCRYAKKEDLPLLEELSQNILRKRCAVFAKRDRNYYERIWEEQRAVNGGILLVYREGELWGYCFTGQEDGTEIWELAGSGDAEDTEKEQARDYARALQAVTEMFGNGEPIKIRGLLPGVLAEGISPKEISWRPVTMVRIVNLAAFVRLLRPSEETDLCLSVRDDFLAENNGCFRLCAGKDGGKLIRLDAGEPAGQAAVPVTIEELTEAFFGLKESKAVPSGCIRPLHPVYFNELV